LRLITSQTKNLVEVEVEYRRRWPKIIDNTRDLRVTNLEHLARGTGAKYLEVMEAHNGDYIAVAWRRKLLDSIPSDHILIVFS